MTLQTLVTKARRRLGAFGKAEDGNVLIIFSLAIIPIFGLVGASIDYSRANSLKANMQVSADSTALAVSKTASSQNATQLSSSASTYFNTLFNYPNAQNLSITATYSPATSTTAASVVVTANATLKTNFMGIMGFSNMPVQVASTTKWGNTKLRVALALDNTGSMADDNKMSALKTATKNLLTQLQTAAAANGDVYVSMIPFAKDVNVGSSNKNATWMDFSGGSDMWDENNGSCSKSNWWGSPQNKSDCQSISGTWSPDSHNTWNGCVMDRTESYDVVSTAASSSIQSSLFPAEQYNACPTQIVPMTYNWTTLTNTVNAMTPNGGTNQGIGLAWAWLSLLQQDPLNAPAENSLYTYNKVIILLTDGLNTQNRVYGNGSSPSSQVDARQQIMCNNIKAAGITIYAIQVNTGGDPTSTLLQSCATDSSKFYLLTSSGQIVTAFNQIGTSLSQLRVAQ